MKAVIPIVIVFLFVSATSAQKVELAGGGKPFRRGTTIQISWKVENSDPVNIELYRGITRITGEVNQLNTGSYSLMIPMHAGLRKDYTIKVTDVQDPHKQIISDNFEVIAKVSLLAKVAPVVAVGVIFVLLKAGAGSNKGGGSPGQGPAPTGN